MTLRDLLTTIFKRKWVLLGFFLAALIGGYAGLKLIAPTYEAKARLLVRIGQEDIFMPVLPTSQYRSPVMSVVREEQLYSEAEIISSPKLAQDVVAAVTPQVLFPGIDAKHPWYTPRGVMQMLNGFYRWLEDVFFPLSSDRNLNDQAVDRFQRDLTAVPVKNSNVIEVALRSKSPDAALIGVNSLVNLYLKERARVYQREETGFMKQQLAQLETQLEGTEHQVDKLRKEGQVVDVERQRSSKLDKLEEARSQMNQLRVALAESDSRAATLKTQLATVPATVKLSGAESTNNFAVSEAAKQLTDLRRREADISSRFSTNDPRLQSLREEIKVVQGMLTQQQQQKYGSTEQGLNPLATRIRDDLLKAEAARDGMRKSLDSWAKVERELQDQLDTINAKEADYKRALQQQTVLRDTRQLYLEKVQENQFQAENASAKGGNVSVVNMGEVSKKPISPKLWMVLVGVLAGGLIGGLGLIFVLEFLDPNLKNETEVERYLNTRLLVKVPQLGAA